MPIYILHFTSSVLPPALYILQPLGYLLSSLPTQKLFKLQCLQSSLAQHGGANHRQHCITDVQKALKTLIKMSQQLPGMFEIVLRRLWWVAGNEQPSPPLHRAAAARLLKCFDKYKSLYTTNLSATYHICNSWELFINVLRAF